MGDSRVTAAVRKVVEIVAGYPAGVTWDELASETRRRSGTPEQRLARLIGQAVQAGLLREESGVLLAARATSATGQAELSLLQPETDFPPAGHRLVRAVLVDVESIVRTTAAEPYVQRDVYEVAARRFGADQEWASARPAWHRYVSLGDVADQVVEPAVRAAVRQRGVPAPQVWEELAGYAADADVVVAYNGTGLDFPLIREAAQAAGCGNPLAERRTVDALYLALSVWPTAPTHRLHALAAETGVNTKDLRAHTASDDVRLLARLLERAAEKVTALGTELSSFIADVCHDSDAWRLLLELAYGGQITEPERRTWDRQEVADLLAGTLATHRPVRTAGTRTGRAPVELAPSLVGEDGRVDPTALAGVVHGAWVEPRPAQQRMTAALQKWTERGTGGLLEAPTGTGKSYAILATALDFLAADPGRTAVIATFTKQLQSQLARDIEDLQQAVPGLIAVADLVKGAVNRLSLSALNQALADATRIRPGRRRRDGFTAYPRFRELAVYLALRLRAATRPPLTWTARSVDPVDVPAFFSDYSGPLLPLWLESLSQRDGDFSAGSGSALSCHTDTVREAVAGHRLVLANHALALTHLDDLKSLGPETLLVLDEAHELENAATAALTDQIDYQELEALLADLLAWADESSSDEGRVSLAEFERLLDDEQLPRQAAQALDAQVKGVGVRIGSRAGTLIGPYSGTAHSRQVRRLSRYLARIARGVSSARTGLERYLAQHAPVLELLARERVERLVRRTDDVADRLNRLTSCIDAFLTPAPTLTGELPSRVVYVEELAEPDSDLRAYRFRIAASPVDLPATPEWRGFLDSFDRVQYVSATLRVGGNWEFIRSRLGLSPSLPRLALPSPFDLRRQAKLVCFSDFPSWAEQEEGAVRTVAHQLAGFAQEVIRKRPGGGGWDGGAMVLTTAKATAAGIGAHLIEQLAGRGVAAPVAEALMLGNGRAYQAFTDQESGGGFLVGTRGLWQGVDVSDPARLRLVWINKLPFAPFAAPVIEARRAAVRERAAEAGHSDPEGAASEQYYLPLAALQLRQAVGRLIRSSRHRGVIVLSDRKLGGHSALRRLYRRAFLGSLDDGLECSDPQTGETGGGNVTTMAEGWRRIWAFLADEGLLDRARAAELCTDEELARQTLLPYTRRIHELRLNPQEEEELAARGLLADEMCTRAAEVAGLLGLSDHPVALRPAQLAAIRAVADGRNMLGLLPTGFGKSFTFQLPALLLPGVTIVVSPLVALMHDQALELNRSIGGAVRALISPLRESSSRAGKTEVADQLLGRADHGIRLIYVSPERLCQSRFQTLVRRAAEAGVVRRVAVDEAHTLVQWEDFRPSMRRIGRFLGELREGHGVAVTAVTATANRSVHEALRAQLFDVPRDIPSPGSPLAVREATCDGVEGALVTVRENPIRPELSLHRRTMRRLGPSGVAGLVEQVVDALEGHAILYCLTVKEVNSLYTHLREYLGDSAVRILRFHGRLTEVEKAATMTAFREAPREDEVDFAPVVVVATSAFGLGVNRPDVRAVLCVSPPTDLSALYQQIGRAGRDSAVRGSAPGRPANVGLALATGRGLRTARFMAGQDLPAPALRRAADLLLSLPDGSFSAADLAERLMEEEAARGALSERDLADRHQRDRHHAAIMRSLSVLADLGTVTDLGDHPPLCAVKPGDIPDIERTADAAAQDVQDVERAVVRAALAWSTPHKVDVLALDRELVRRLPAYRDVAEGPAATWELLIDLHDRGLLDVSAAPSHHLVTGLRVHRRAVPASYLPLMTRRSARAAEELDRLRAFFDAPDRCAQRLLADYFGVDDLPQGSCATADCRCSACWNHGDWPRGERRPAVAEAFAGLRPYDGGGADAALRDHHVDRQVHRLLQLQPRGMHPRRLLHALRGDETAYHAGERRMLPLPESLRTSRYFGGRAGATPSQVDESLARLAAAGAAAHNDSGLWYALPGTLPAPHHSITLHPATTASQGELR
ncbi:DEAD/DEAH box helicase [Streptomyces sp. RTd22]|uniref:DEAD/DEAH box helicase n=1 Tax=Streptomyces sp. RTd22 TaxID=1841249 RepID=UPI0007DA15C4|nr:DEAD/DEAH box helicase [Streptomyces sp. RTd22]